MKIVVMTTIIIVTIVIIVLTIIIINYDACWNKYQITIYIYIYITIPMGTKLHTNNIHDNSSLVFHWHISSPGIDRIF